MSLRGLASSNTEFLGVRTSAVKMRVVIGGFQFVVLYLKWKVSLLEINFFKANVLLFL